MALESSRTSKPDVRTRVVWTQATMDDSSTSLTGGINVMFGPLCAAAVIMLSTCLKRLNPGGKALSVGQTW